MRQLLVLSVFFITSVMVHPQRVEQILQYDDRGYLLKKTILDYLPNQTVDFKEYDNLDHFTGRKLLFLNGRSKPERLELYLKDSPQPFKTEVYEPDYAGERVLVNTWFPGESQPVRKTIYQFKNKILQRVTMDTPERGSEVIEYEQIRSSKKWETVQKDREGFILFDEYWEKGPDNRVLWGIRRDGAKVERLDISYQDKRIDVTCRFGSKIYIQTTYIYSEAFSEGQPMILSDIPGPNNLVLWEHFF